jgi:3-deoxy-D-manno-octulosonic-acid transferase
METELWPNMVHICAKKGVKVAVVNGRLSDRSYDKYKKWTWLVAPMLKSIDIFITQTESDAKNFIALDADPNKVHIVGNLKFDISQLNSDDREPIKLKTFNKTGRRVLIAASTRKGEEEKVLNAFRFVLKKMPSVILILVPRHPERFQDVAKHISDFGFNFSSRSDGKELVDSTQVYLGDSMGELLAYYRLADVAFVGGTLVDTGCQNILEPAALGLPILVGPSQYNFAKICSELEAASALRTVNNTEELGLAFIEFLSDAARCREMGKNGKEFVQKRQNIVSETLASLDKIYKVL